MLPFLAIAILTDVLIDAYPNKIINIHPSLIPAFCGPGHYGMHVHEKVLARGVKVTGATATCSCKSRRNNNPP